MKRPKQVDLNDAVQHPGRVVPFEVETSLEEEEDIDLLRPITGKLEAASTGNMLFIDGSLKVEMVLECSRCLKPIEVRMDLQVHEEFTVEGVPAGFGNREYAEVKEEGEAYPLFDGNSLKWEDLVRQSLWLSMPTRAVCSDDCPGMGDYEPLSGPERPELAVLSQLLEDQEESS
ncbi:MAG: DUF177 domain-containing protein [Fimbriimonadales bacterium]